MADYNLLYHTTLSVTVATAGVVDAGNGLFYKDFTIPEQVLGETFLEQAVRERRIGDEYGATVEFFDNVTLRMKWYGDPATTEGLVNDETTGLDEIIEVDVQVKKMDEFFSDIKELLFRALRILGYLGENVMQDLLVYDTPGNLVQYRLRIFSTKEYLEAATPDRPDGSTLQAGEVSRVTMDQDILLAKNDRSLLTRVLTDVIDTPGND